MHARHIFLQIRARDLDGGLVMAAALEQSPLLSTADAASDGLAPRRRARAAVVSLSLALALIALLALAVIDTRIARRGGGGGEGEGEGSAARGGSGVAAAAAQLPASAARARSSVTPMPDESDVNPSPELSTSSIECDEYDDDTLYTGAASSCGKPDSVYFCEHCTEGTPCYDW
jgi:hypothetical protein